MIVIIVIIVIVIIITIKIIISIIRIIIIIIILILIIPSAIHAPQLHPLGRLGAESSEVRVGMVTVGPGYRLYGFRV